LRYTLRDPIRLTPSRRSSLDNEDIVTTRDNGTFESSGIHRWRTQADVTRSDGGTIHTEGDMELAGRTWKGKVFKK
jgi:hypothetical protein